MEEAKRLTMDWHVTAGNILVAASMIITVIATLSVTVYISNENRVDLKDHVGIDRVWREKVDTGLSAVQKDVTYIKGKLEGNNGY